MPAVRLVLPTPPLPFAIATTRLTCHTLHIHRCAHPDPTSGLTGGATPNWTGADTASTTGEAPPSGPAVRHGAPTSNATPGSSPVRPPDEHDDATGDLTACANGEPPAAAPPVGHGGDTSSVRPVSSPVARARGHGDAHHGAHPDHTPFPHGCGTPNATAGSAAEPSPGGTHEAPALACDDPTAFAAPVERPVCSGGRHGAGKAVARACASAEPVRTTFAVSTGDAVCGTTSCVQPEPFAGRSPGDSGAAHDEISPVEPAGCPGEMNGGVHGTSPGCTLGVPRRSPHRAATMLPKVTPHVAGYLWTRVVPHADQQAASRPHRAWCTRCRSRLLRTYPPA